MGISNIQTTFKVDIAEQTPPDTPKWTDKTFSFPVQANNDNDALKLIGTTKFEPRNDINNILITGGAGFIGSWVARHLTIQYPHYTIICVDKLDHVSSPSNISCLQAFPNFKFVHADILTPGAMDQVLAEHSIDCIMHFAANSHVQTSFHDQHSFTVNNVIATQMLLDAARKHARITRFIHVSTDEVYGEINEDFADETTRFLPTNPYAASKAAAEMYVHAYYKSFGIPVVIVRSNNVYGPCQYPEKIIPRFYALLAAGRDLTVQGTGRNRRRYLYGGDAAEGFDTVLHRGVVGEAYNIESGDGISNIDVAVRMLGLFGYDADKEDGRRIHWVEDRPFNDFDYRVDGSKLRALGWRQRTGFEEGLKATVEWYGNHLDSWWAADTAEEVCSSTAVADAKREELQLRHAVYKALETPS